MRDDSHTIGYLRITQFSESVPKKIEEALQELKDKEVEAVSYTHLTLPTKA